MTKAPQIHCVSFLLIALAAALTTTYIQAAPCTHVRGVCLTWGPDAPNTTCCIYTGFERAFSDEYLLKNAIASTNFECGTKTSIGFLGIMRYCSENIICEYCCGGARALPCDS